MRTTIAALLVLAVAGCTPAPQPEPGWHGPPPGGPRHGPGIDHGPGGDGAPPPPRARLFISPMGEPFRGSMSGAELVARWFDGADTDHDGRLGRGEFRADALRFFAVLDTNHDGIIDPDEIRVYETELVPEIMGGGEGAAPAMGGRGGGRGGGGRHGGGGMGGGGGGHRGGGGNPSESDDASAEPHASAPAYDATLRGAGRFGLLNIPEPVISADVDMNRSVTPAEFAAAADRRFALLDTNADGVIDRAELPDFSPHMGPGRRRH